VDNIRINLASISPIINGLSDNDDQILAIQKIYSTINTIFFEAENQINKQ